MVAVVAPAMVAAVRAVALAKVVARVEGDWAMAAAATAGITEVWRVVVKVEEA